MIRTGKIKMRVFAFYCLALLLCGCAADRPYSAAVHGKKTPSAAQVRIVSGKRSDHSIVLPAQFASVSEMQMLRQAAAALQESLRESTGVRVPIVAEKRCCYRKECSNIIKGIYIGNCIAAANAGISTEELTSEEYLAVERNGAVFITGKTPGGTLSGVKAFMKKILGTKFLYPGTAGRTTPGKSVISIEKSLCITGVRNALFDPAPIRASLLFEGMTGSYGLEGPLFYIRSHKQENFFLPALWNFCRAAFGQSALHMFDFYKMLYGKKFPALRRQPWPGTFCTPDLLKKMDSRLRAAEQEKVSSKVRSRLMLIRREFDCLYHLSALAHHQNSYRLSPDRSGFDKMARAVELSRRSLALCFDAKGKNRKVTGWPEMTLWNNTPQHKLTNTVSLPLSWNINAWRRSRTLPGLSRKVIHVFPLKKGAWQEPEKGAWQKVPFEQLSERRDRVLRLKTWFKAAYDKQNLYLIFKAELPRDRKYKALGRDRNAADADHLELFITPHRSKSTWRLLWNPAANSSWDGIKGRITDPLSARFGTFDKSWNGKWKVRNFRKNDLWYSRVIIPWNMLNSEAPRRDERWQINIGRFDRPGNKLPNERSLWVPDWDNSTGGTPEFYGEFVFRRK